MSILIVPPSAPVAPPPAVPRLFRDLPAAGILTPDGIGGRNFANTGFEDIAPLLTDDDDATRYTTGSSFGHAFAHFHTQGAQAVRALWVRFGSGGTRQMGLAIYEASNAHFGNGIPNGSQHTLLNVSHEEAKAGIWHRFEIDQQFVTGVGFHWSNGPAGTFTPPIAELRIEGGDFDRTVDLIERGGKYFRIDDHSEYTPHLKPAPAPLELRRLHPDRPHLNSVESVVFGGNMPPTNTPARFAVPTHLLRPGRTRLGYLLHVLTTAGWVNPAYYQNTVTYSQFGAQVFFPSDNEVEFNVTGTALLSRPYRLIQYFGG